MNESRKLALRRETLCEIDLRDVTGAGPDPQTRQSCLDYVSCWDFQCLFTLTCPESRAC